MCENNNCVSVVIPYSPEHTPKEMLLEAKETVNEQNINTEIIVVVDEEQHGPAWARNKGIKKADTRYIAFLDADDLWNRGKLTRQMRQLEKTDAAICVEGREMSTNEFIEAVLGGELSSITSSILYDSKKLNIDFEDSLDRREDHLFVLEAASREGICFCDNIVQIRKHSKGLSSRDTRNLVKSDELFEDFLKDRISDYDKYQNIYKSEKYHQMGRREYFEGAYRQSIKYLYKSLSFQFRLKTFVALTLSLYKYTHDSIWN